jgi:threonylcarbamoyladenosine tRNA methylthiotransferase MtaB
MPRVAFSTLGCKVNQSETDLLARQFAAAGYACVKFDDPADIYVVNTCTVTHVADKKSRQVLSQARRLNPEALVVATGCYASIVGDALAGPGTMVVRNRDKNHLLAAIEGRLGRTNSDGVSPADPEKYLDVSGGRERSRAMVKAQDGCDSHCAYCIIPRARGRSRSVAPEQVIRRVEALVRAGHAEVVITGVDLGSYGEDRESYPDLGGLLRQVLDETEVRRVRVSSLEPGDFREDWLQLWADSRLCRHLHVPLQSGSAAVLERMGRRYSPQQFSEMVTACRSVPDMTITTDVMVGFPGESGDEFAEGYQFIRQIAFDGMHVFKYSRRSGTPAARFSNQVEEDVKAERSRTLREEAAAGTHRLLARHAGAIHWVVWEETHDGIARGMTDTNVRVFGSSTARSENMTREKLTVPFQQGLWSEPLYPEIPLVPV